MARMLEFQFKGRSFKCGVDKVDREALYGRVDIETHDRDGSRCEIATLAADGRTLVTSGGTAMGYMTGDGLWIERNELTPVDIGGNRLNTLPSSFDHPHELEMRASAERFLDHSIRSAYLLAPDEHGIPETFTAELDGGAIFKFDFSWRGGVSADPAFILKGADGAVWMLVGAENAIDFVGFMDAKALDAEAEDAPADDDLDFEMM
ncbi:MAG: hypothetical protein K2Y05_07310 [Hyphomicrobiaceae bacterium]|nr:hypothetical protein [Hyphomicrobiaceae bacterium]